MKQTKDRIAGLHGRFFCTENGRHGGTRYAFSGDCLLGLHLILPRSLGAHEVLACLTPDAGGESLSVPLSLIHSEHGWEEYAAMLDTARIFSRGRLFFLTLSFRSVYGLLYGRATEGERVSFSHEAGRGFPLLLTEQREELTVGGGVLAMPFSALASTGELCRGEDGDYDRFFSHLAAHGIKALLLSLSACEGAGLREEALALPPAARESAAAHGVACLFDLLPFVSLHKVGRLPDPTDPQGYDLCDTGEASAIPPACGIEDPISPATLCGEGGILARAIDGGYFGVFLRYADRFGDPFLCAVRRELSLRAQGALFLGCVACPDVDGIAFGRRRRFFDGALDGLVSYALRNALLAYLSDGATELLSSFLSRTLGAMPTHQLCHAVHPLDEPSGVPFSSLLAPLVEGQVGEGHLSDLSRLAFLIAATLPGMPMLPEGGAEEEAFAFRLRLFGMRRKEKTLHTGRLRLHTLTPDLLVFSREREGEMLLTVINRSPDALKISSAEGFSVLFGGRGRKLLYRLAPYSGTVLRFELFTGEVGALSFQRVPILSRDTRFTVRSCGASVKSS